VAYFGKFDAQAVTREQLVIDYATEFK